MLLSLSGSKHYFFIHSVGNLQVLYTASELPRCYSCMMHGYVQSTEITSKIMIVLVVSHDYDCVTHEEGYLLAINCI